MGPPRRGLGQFGLKELSREPSAFRRAMYLRSTAPYFLKFPPTRSLPPVSGRIERIVSVNPALNAVSREPSAFKRARFVRSVALTEPKDPPTRILSSGRATRALIPGGITNPGNGSVPPRRVAGKEGSMVPSVLRRRTFVGLAVASKCVVPATKIRESDWSAILRIPKPTLVGGKAGSIPPAAKTACSRPGRTGLSCRRREG